MPVLPEGKSLYVSQPLTNISNAYGQSGRWIADQVFPTVPVARQGARTAASDSRRSRAYGSRRRCRGTTPSSPDPRG